MEETFGANIHQELGKLRAQLENLLKQAQEKKDEASSEVLEKLSRQIETLRQKVGPHMQTVYHAGQTGVTETEKFVRQNPLLSIGIAFGAGCVLGCLFRR